jgi:hypothetical protein
VQTSIAPDSDAEADQQRLQVGEDKPVLLLDADGTMSPAAAKELKDAAPMRPTTYYITGGAEAWLQAELPWKEPLRVGLNFETLKAIDISGVAKGAAARLTQPSDAAI